MLFILLFIITCRTTIGQHFCLKLLANKIMSADKWPTVGQQSAVKRPTVGQQFFRELFFTFTSPTMRALVSKYTTICYALK